MPEITVSDVGEFGLIAGSPPGSRRPSRRLLGPGDDAAVIARPTGGSSPRPICSSRTGTSAATGPRANDVGHKAAARNFADIAAMGAVPTALLVGFAAPARPRPRPGSTG